MADTTTHFKLLRRKLRGLVLAVSAIPMPEEDAQAVLEIADDCARLASDGLGCAMQRHDIGGGLTLGSNAGIGGLLACFDSDTDGTMH